MIESLTPIEETRAYKELVAKGREEGREEGKEEGKQESKKEIAKKMLNRGDDVKSIIEVTDLSIEEIEKIKKEL